MFGFFSSKKPETSPDKTVVVIGGGIAGLSAIYGLRKIDAAVKIILVDPKEYAEIFWATYRSPFEEWVAKGSIVVLKKYCEEYNVKHVQAKVTKMNNQSVTLDNGETIAFDACTIATGADAHWVGMGRGLPSTKEDATTEARLKALKAEGERMLNAEHVVIVGGGLIGTELAGDVAEYAKKAGKSPKITLVHSGSQLCPVMSESAAAAVQQMLEGLGVKVILNEKASLKGGSDKVLVLESSKEELEADVIVKTTGFIPINSFVKDAFPGDIDEKGWVKTDEHFLVPGSGGKVFAFGDCSSTSINAGNVYMGSSGALGHNIKVVLSQHAEMKPFEPPTAVYCNTIGPNKGVFYTSAFWTRLFLPWIKNKTMFFMAPRDTIGVKKEFTLAD